MRRIIDGDDLAAADSRLSAILKIGTGNFKDRQFSHAGVRRENYERFLSHHRNTLRMHVARAAEGADGMPNLTPEQEAAVLTMMTHFFLIGVLAGQESVRT